MIWGRTRATDFEKRIGVRLSLLNASDLMTIYRPEVESLAGTSPGRPQVWEKEIERRSDSRSCEGRCNMANEMNDVAKAVIDAALTAFRSNKGWADKAVGQLADDKLHIDP